MKKIMLGLCTIFILLSSTGCSNKEANKGTNYLPNPIDSSWTDSDKTYELVGELSDFGLLADKPILTGKENTYTWLFWVGKEDEKDPLLGKTVELYAQNEKSEKKLFLSTGKIKALDRDDPQPPDSDSVLKYNSAFRLMTAGKWQIDSYVDKKLIGSVVVMVADKK
ncbi:MAG: hypothetical protein ABF649_04575 [Bacillus sp. (in: firmicutes)]